LDCKDIKFTKSDMLLLNILYQNKVVKTYKIPKKYHPLISRATLSRSIHKLRKLGFIEPVGKKNYMSIYKRVVPPQDLCIIPFPVLC